MIAGILFQIYKGFYDFEIGHYLYELYAIRLIHFVIWALFALFIQTLFKNYLLGFFVLLLLSIGMNFLPEIGVEQMIYQFNSDPGFEYSDMNGYGHGLKYYYLYKGYWLAFGFVLFALALLFFTRGIGQSIKGRFADANHRMKKQIAIPMLLSLVGFLAIGSTIYYQDNVVNDNKSGKEQELEMVSWEKK